MGPLTSLLSPPISNLLLVHSIEDNYNLTNEAKQALRDTVGSSVRIKF